MLGFRYIFWAFEWYQNRWPWMTLNGVMAFTLRYFTEFGKPVLQKTNCDGIYARDYCIFSACTVQCRRKESSRSLSHLLMSFLYSYAVGYCRDGNRTEPEPNLHFWKNRTEPKPSLQTWQEPKPNRTLVVIEPESNRSTNPNNEGSFPSLSLRLSPPQKKIVFLDSGHFSNNYCYCYCPKKVRTCWVLGISFELASNFERNTSHSCQKWQMLPELLSVPATKKAQPVEKFFLCVDCFHRETMPPEAWLLLSC